MQKNILFAFLVAILFSTCKEETVYVPPLSGGNNQQPTGGERNVLVEEFTGVKCVNCPDGAAEIANLKKKYGERLVPISIHAGFFAKKLPESKYDLKAPQSTSLLNMLSEPEGYPAVVINRKTLGVNNTFPVIGLSKWAGLIELEAKEQAKALLQLESTYSDTDRKLKVSVSITPTTTLVGEYHLSIMLAENNIIDAQVILGKGTDPNYVHQHVLRDMLTNFDGLKIAEPLTKGATIKKEFEYTIPANFKAEDCEVIAFLNQAASSKEVIQAAAKKVKK
jgi:hypothetical protein